MTAIVHRRLANVTCSGPNGDFEAMFSTTDRTAFDAVVVGDYTLRYLSADATLERDDSVAVDGVQYVVADEPMQINALERMVGLRRDD